MNSTYTDVVAVNGIDYECHFEIEPSQRGGMIDPSWDAHCYDLAITLNGADIKPGDVDILGFDNSELYSAIEKEIDKRIKQL
jgi:hypothetical protein